MELQQLTTGTPWQMQTGPVVVGRPVSNRTPSNSRTHGAADNQDSPRRVHHMARTASATLARLVPPHVYYGLQGAAVGGMACTCGPALYVLALGIGDVITNVTHPLSLCAGAIGATAGCAVGMIYSTYGELSVQPGITPDYTV